MSSIPRKSPVAAKSSSSKLASKPQKTHKKKTTEKKIKVIRDSFTMPQDDYALIADLKEKAIAAGVHVKKSELLRAGLRLLAKSNAAQLKRIVTGLEKIKTGRPRKV